jgi:hypothetical protein
MLYCLKLFGEKSDYSVKTHRIILINFRIIHIDAILHTISYIVSGCPVQNRISLSIGFLCTGYGFLNTDLVRKLSYPFTSLDEGDDVYW